MNSNSIIFLISFCCICNGIYIQQDETTKPPRHKEKLPQFDYEKYKSIFSAGQNSSLLSGQTRKGENDKYSFYSSYVFDRAENKQEQNSESKSKYEIQHVNEKENESTEEQNVLNSANGANSTKKNKRNKKISYNNTKVSVIQHYRTNVGITSFEHPSELCPSGATGQYPYPADCQKFVNCWKGRGFIQPCAPGTLFNQHSRECDFPSKVKCTELDEYVQNVEEITSKSEVSDAFTSQNFTQESTTSTNVIEEATPKICGDQSISGLFPHPTDCSKYINCWNGVPYVNSCGPGTLFNPVILVCDHPYNVDCPVDTTTVSYTKAECSMPGGTGLLPHPTDCSKFLNCWNGKAHIQDCSPGTLFNPSKLVCDWPYNVNCAVASTEDNEISFTTYATSVEIFTTVEENTTDSSYVSNTSPLTSTKTTYMFTETSPTTTRSSTEYSSTSLPENKPQPRMETNGQVLRLRGGSGPWNGYVEVQGSTPGWGIVCDERNNWTIQEANVICKHLGFESGAAFSWQGRPISPVEDTLSIAVHSVRCTGNELKLSDCHLSNGTSSCVIARDAVGVHCYLNSASMCEPHDMNFDGKCYTLVDDENGGFTHGEAIAHCHSMGGHLLDINSQDESDFISEWLLQNYSNITSIITAGVGVMVSGKSVWVWEASESPFTFQKWWPGWTWDHTESPIATERPLCVVAKREFPCELNYKYFVQMSHGNMCEANYFYWDTEDCSITHKHPYICEKPHHDIGCVNGYGEAYNGTANVTANGNSCLRWDSDVVKPFIRYKVSETERIKNFVGHNFCRNPGGTEAHPWCIIGPKGKSEHCNIPICLRVGDPRNPAECKDNEFICELNECITSTKICDGRKDCTNGRDEFACNNHLLTFKKYERNRLENYDVQKYIHSDPDSCAQQCIKAEAFVCRSFSYNVIEKVCYLSDSNLGLSGSLKPWKNWDYYEMISRTINCTGNFLCKNFKCVNTSVVCDGKNDCGDRSDENTCSVEIMDYDIRLAGSNLSNEGRIEVKVFGKWGFICDDLFGPINADVVCKELGFSLGAVDVLSYSFFPPHENDTLFLVDDLQCRGNETSIRECEFNGWGIHDCNPEEVAGVRCRIPGVSCPSNNWQCSYSKECIHISFLCDNIVDCEDNSDEDAAQCQAPIDIRLAGGPSKIAGRIEVRYKGVWGTVCDDDFTHVTASVFCHMLGYKGPAEAKKNAVFGSGDGQIWLDELHCIGNESSIEECLHSEWGKHNCNHDEDASVVCSTGEVWAEESHSLQETTEISIPPNLNDILPAECGKRINKVGEYDGKNDPRVVGGHEVTKGSYPWQASVRVRASSKSLHWCGAVIISPLHILTAAHCLQDYTKGVYLIRVGDHDTEEDDGTEQEVNIDEIYFHEHFNKHAHLNNDVALVKLKGRGIMLGSGAQPACLPFNNAAYTPGMNCTISGWGSVKSAGSGYARRLQAVWVPILPHDTCRANFIYGSASITSGMFCAGHLEGGVDSCQGDSGGPLVCLYNGYFTLFGITSWGHGCGRPNKPGVYTNVSYYREWISRKLQDSLGGR